MLSEEEIAELRPEMEALPRRQAACIEALKIVQKHRGWIDDQALRDVAEYLDMSVEALDNVATFYNHLFRKPVGRHLLRMCDSVSCWILGYDRLRECVKAALGVDLGQTTADHRFTLLTIPCLGCCDHAPALMVDDDLHQDVAPAHLADILARYE
jgi:NADH-quinone oxidoreductase subunit E